MAVNRIDNKGVRVHCPRCDKLNRLPFAKLALTGKCGSCGASLEGTLSAPAEVIDERAFAALLKESSLPVLVDYWAPWCGPCRMVAPELEKVAKRNAGRWLVAKVDTEHLPAVGAQMGIQSIPTMAVYQHGHELRRSSGARPAHAIESFVREALVE